MNYVVLCQDGVLYNWCAVLLESMKGQLTKSKTGGQRQFCYGLILASFFFERVPVTWPWGSIPSYSLRDPAMKKWCAMMTWLGGGRFPEFGEDFFS